ncbi:MAG: hypothetical protein D6753_15390 [Planctomycetota bacterium]|nr:MAG: hypothetical protein D6753_15390 [Planctomycetota bacterium]
MLLFSVVSLLANAGKCQELSAVTSDKVQQVIADGDRAADAGDYQRALIQYTKAYLSIVAKIRGQSFVRPVEPTILDRDELRQELEQMLRQELTPEETRLMNATYKAFGFVSPDVDIESLMTELLTEQVAGFYDPEKERMVMIVERDQPQNPGFLARLFGARPAFDKDEQKATLAHELTHALQDQLYDLDGMEARIKDDDDLLLAFSALVEGDATLVMFAESTGEDITQADPAALRASFSLMSWLVPLSAGKSYREAPPILRESLMFPYLEGMLFAVEIASRQGWQGLHRAFQHPPESTEQILHPEKYFRDQAYDPPRKIRVPDLPQALAEKWEHVGGNCLGEFQMTVLFKPVFGGRQAAAGWDGDRYEIYENADDKLAMVWVTVWDSPADAQQFKRAYEAYREPRSHFEDIVFPADAEQKVEVDGDQVWVVTGFDAAETTRIIERLPACEITPKHFPQR